MQRAIKTTAQALAQQKADAERDRRDQLQALANKKLAAAMQPTSTPRHQPAAKQPQDGIERLSSKAVAPAKATSVAVPDTRDPRDQYLDRIAPTTIVGRRLRFDTKEGRYVTPDTGEEIGDDIAFIALCDQTVIGWRRFHGKGEQPSYIIGMWYDGYLPPKREDLPDRDQRAWEISNLTGELEDPWKEIMWLVLQRVDTGELFTFEAAAPTHLPAVGKLLQHFRRRERRHPDQYPIVRLGLSGWDRGPPVGWVHKPNFIVTGHTAKDNAAAPATLQEEMNDEIPEDFSKK
jgi:hypothetical protein